MKKLFALLLAGLMLLSTCAALAENTVAIPYSANDLGLEAPEGVSMVIHGNGVGNTKLELSGPVDSVEVNYHGEIENAELDGNVASFNSAGHKWQQGNWWNATWDNWYDWLSKADYPTVDDLKAGLKELGVSPRTIEESEWGYSVFTEGSVSGGDDAYQVHIGSATFVHSREGYAHTIYDWRYQPSLFAASKDATVTWKRTLNGVWFPYQVSENYDGEITNVTATYGGDGNRSLVNYVVTYNIDGAEYKITFGANNQIQKASASKDGVDYVKGSAFNAGKWINASGQWWYPASDDAGLKPISEFTAPIAAE